MEFGLSNNDYMNNLLLKEQAMEKMRELGNFWIGPDISLEKKVTIPPLATIRNINLIINKSHLPPIEITRGTFSSMKWSVRSCHAQSGTDILFHQANLSDEMIKNINEGKNVSIPVDIVNVLDRPVELEGDLMRFFWVNEFNRLRHEKLRDVIGTELIIEGKEGIDWSFGDAADVIERDKYPKESKDLCIVLKLNEKYYIPPSTETLRVDSKKDLSNVLQKIPEGKVAYFSVGETVNVKMGKNIIAVLVTKGYDQGMHLYSPLIDSGFEGPIRTETMFGLKELDVYIYKN